MSPELCEEYAALYALGLLEGPEKKAFEQELAQNPVAGAMVAEFETASSLLVGTLPKRVAPPTLRTTILQSVQSEKPVAEPAKKFQFSPLWIPWGVAALLAIFSVVIVTERSQLASTNNRLAEENKSLQVRIAGLDAERDRLQTRVDTLESEKKSIETRLASMQPPKDPLESVNTLRLAPQAPAKPDTEVLATWDAERQQGMLNLARLPLPPAGMSYQLWIISPDSAQPIDAGVIVSNTARFEFKAPYPVKVAALAISLEPSGGSPSPTTVVYVGKM